MRLIDAERLLADLDAFPYVKQAIDSLIEEQPTIEAVPADYIREKIRDLDNSIKKYGGRFDYSAAVDAWILQRGALEGLIAEWEEE